MDLKNIFKFFLPKDSTFFPLFNQATADLVKLSELLHEAINVPKEERDSYYQKMDQLELSIEEITHKTNLELSRNFITPFDREDIHSLITSIDEVSDNINGAASRMRLYQVEEITKSIRKLTEINLDACRHINLAVNELKEMKNLKNILAAVKSIIKLERKSDTVFSKAVAELFEHETDAKNIIKYREVLISLEKATDKCRGVALTLESVAVKHS